MEKQIEKLQQQLKEQEKLAALGILSAGIAHEVQNPLNFVINFSKLSVKLLSDLSDIVDDNKDKLPADDREELNDIVADLRENMDKIAEHGERAIDPTSLNKQGHDEGTRYRTGVYYTDAEDLPIIERVFAEEQQQYDQPLAVEKLPLQNYYSAEEYHQDYLDKNPTGYCHLPQSLFEFAREYSRVKPHAKP